MRLRGFVFERFVTFERAEVNVCDERGTPVGGATGARSPTHATRPRARRSTLGRKGAR